MDDRIGWDEYFMSFAKLASQRSTCLRRRVGAVIVKDYRVIATGYNGSPKGVVHCSKTGCLRKELGVKSGTMAEICRGVHAEQNAIIQSAFHGVSVKDSIMYVECSPCAICMKMIINAGIKEVRFIDEYPDELAKELAKEAGYIWGRVGVLTGKDGLIYKDE